MIATMSAPPKPSSSRPPHIQKDASGQTKKDEDSGLSDHIQYMFGIGVLTLALVISAFMGLFQEKTYKRYGRGGAVWQESIFYSVRVLFLSCFCLQSLS